MNSVQVINESRDKLEKILNENITMEDVKFAFRISQKIPKCVFNTVKFEILAWNYYWRH